MGKIKVKSISFTEEYLKEYDFIQKMGNASRYICELIRKDRVGIKENNQVQIVNNVLSSNNDLGNLLEDLLEDMGE